MGSTTGGLLTNILGRLGPRRMAWIFGVLFVVNLIVPDPIPVVDELLLGLLTLILAQIRTGPTEPAAGDGSDGTKPPMKNVTPQEDPRR